MIGFYLSKWNERMNMNKVEHRTQDKRSAVYTSYESAVDCQKTK